MLTTYRDKAPHHLCVCARACVRVCTCMCVCPSTWSLPAIVSTYPYQMLTTYRNKATHYLCVCARVCVRVCTCMCVCCQHGVYHLSYPPSFTKCKQPTEIKHHTICVHVCLCVCVCVCVCMYVCVCVCVCMYVCVSQHGVFHLSYPPYPPSVTKC